jgi:hypothetical protein
MLYVAPYVCAQHHGSKSKYVTTKKNGHKKIRETGYMVTAFYKDEGNKGKDSTVEGISESKQKKNDCTGYHLVEQKLVAAHCPSSFLLPRGLSPFSF